MTTVAVLSRPERRRRWSAAEKTRIVAESLQPGAMVAAVAHRHDVHPNLLHHWRSQARRAPVERARFLPVTLAEAPKVAAAGGTIVIELGDVRVRVDAAVDEAACGAASTACRCWCRRR